MEVEQSTATRSGHLFASAALVMNAKGTNLMAART